MTKISTKNANLTIPGADFISSVIRPGNHKIKIHNVTFKLNPKIGDRIQLFVETEPIGASFRGLPIDKNVANGPCYAGQVGYISLDRWGYKNFDNGTVSILRDDEIFRAIGLLCRGIGLGLTEWWDGSDGKFDTMDELVNAFIKDRPFDGVWFHACVSGRAYLNGTYVNYELYFPRESRTLGVAYSLNKDRVQTFFESTHIDPLKPKATITQTSSVNNHIDELVKTGQTTVNNTEPAKPLHVSAQEQAFINEGLKEKEAKAKAERDQAFLESMNENNPADESTKGIITSEDNTPLPWEV